MFYTAEIKKVSVGVKSVKPSTTEDKPKEQPKNVDLWNQDEEDEKPQKTNDGDFDWDAAPNVNKSAKPQDNGGCMLLVQAYLYYLLLGDWDTGNSGQTAAATQAKNDNSWWQDDQASKVAQQQPQQKIQPSQPQNVDIKSLYNTQASQPSTQPNRLQALDNAFSPQVPQNFHHGWNQAQLQQQQQQFPTNQFQQMNFGNNNASSPFPNQGNFQQTNANFSSTPNAGFSQSQNTNVSGGFGQLDFKSGYGSNIQQTNQSSSFAFNNNSSANTNQNKQATNIGQDEGFEDFQTAEAKRRSVIASFIFSLNNKLDVYWPRNGSC